MLTIILRFISCC